MADLVLAAKPGYAFSGGSEGETVVEAGLNSAIGFHGYLSTDPDMNAMFLAWGYGIRPGSRLEVIDNLDVAPTVAALLGLKMDGVDGKPLLSILK